MRDILFKKQTALLEPDLLAYARNLGLGLTAFQKCLAGTTIPRIRLQMKEAERAGVTSTPTFLIGRVESSQSVRVMYRIRGTQPYSTLARVLKDTMALNAGLTN